MAGLQAERELQKLAELVAVRAGKTPEGLALAVAGLSDLDLSKFLYWISDHCGDRIVVHPPHLRARDLRGTPRRAYVRCGRRGWKRDVSGEGLTMTINTSARQAGRAAKAIPGPLGHALCAALQLSERDRDLLVKYIDGLRRFGLDGIDPTGFLNITDEQIRRLWGGI